jgi:VanZ family protein
MLGNSDDAGHAEGEQHAVSPRLGRPRWRAIFAFTVVLSLIILFAPRSSVPNAPIGVDKVVHFGLFLALGVSGALAGARRRVLLPVLIAYAVASEFIQGTPLLDRDASAFDALADTAGAAFGVLVLAARVARWLGDRERRAARAG